KIGDNESPFPMDRLFFTYNGYFQNRFPAIEGTQIGQTDTGPIRNRATITSTTSTTNIVAAPIQYFDVHRELFGFEKTFLDGDASVGIRVPIFQSYGAPFTSFGGGRFGDITIILKGALFSNRETNDILSVGLALSVPSGPAIESIEGNIDSVLFQPFIG